MINGIYSITNKIRRNRPVWYNKKIDKYIFTSGKYNTWNIGSSYNFISDNNYPHAYAPLNLNTVWDWNNACPQNLNYRRDWNYAARNYATELKLSYKVSKNNSCSIIPTPSTLCGSLLNGHLCQISPLLQVSITFEFFKKTH